MSRKRSISEIEKEDFGDVDEEGIVDSKIRRRICPHCDQSLTIKTWRTHKRLYFNPRSRSWITVSSHDNPSSESDSPPPSSSLTFGMESASSSSPDHVTFSPAALSTSDEEQNSSFSEPESDPLQMVDQPDEEWVDDEQLSSGFKHDIGCESDPEDSVRVQTTPIQSQALVKWLSLFLLQLQAAYRLSNGVINCLFRFLKTFLLVISTFSVQCLDLARVFPSNP